MSSSSVIFIRGISTTCINFGKRNFRKFQIPNKRGSRAFKLQQSTYPNTTGVPIDKRGTRDVGFRNEYGDFVKVPEKIPELIVPSLENFNLKAYVSYKVDGIQQSKFTPQELFNKVYANKIMEDFDNEQLHPDGQPINPNENEKMTPEEAKANASKTGCDIFTDGDKRPSWLY